MIKKSVIFAIFAFFLSAIQLGWFANFAFFASFDLLVTVLLYFFIDRFDSYLWGAVLLVGLVLDVASPWPIGVFTFSVLITCLIVNFLSHNWLTNRSIYTLLFLGFLGLNIYKFQIIFWRSIDIFSVSSFLVPDWSVMHLGLNLAAEICLLAILFWIFNVFLKKTN